jgi:hypothetical protein
MSRYAVAGALALCAMASSTTACGRAGSARLEGRWRGVRAEGGSGGSSESLVAANLFALRTELEVSGDTMKITTGTETQVGRYRVVYENDTSVTITTDKDGPDAPQTFTFEGPRALRWLAAQGESLVFAKP